MALDRFIKSISPIHKDEAMLGGEILLTKEEYIEKLQKIRERCQKKGPITIERPESGLICKIRYYEIRDLPALEFRTGDSQSVETPDWKFEQLGALQDLTQVIFYPEENKGVYLITQANIEKQSKTLSGPTDYLREHRVEAKVGNLYMPSIGQRVSGIEVGLTNEGIEFNNTQMEVTTTNDKTAFMSAISQIETILNPIK